MKTAAQANAAWVAAAVPATAAYDAGVTNYTGDWAGATTAQEQTMLINITQAINNGTWRNKVNAVGTQGWKTATVNKKANYQAGYNAGSAAQLASATKLFNALSGIVPGLPARGTYAENKVRATTLMDALHALRGTLGAK